MSSPQHVSSEQIARLVNAAMDACRECADAPRVTFLDVVRVAPDTKGRNWDMPALRELRDRTACGRALQLRKRIAELRERYRLA